MTEDDLEPLRALVMGLEQARLAAGWTTDASDDPVQQEPTAAELLDLLQSLHGHGRNVYDGLAAKIEGARPYDEITGDTDRGSEQSSDPDMPF